MDQLRLPIDDKANDSSQHKELPLSDIGKNLITTALLRAKNRRIDDLTKHNQELTHKAHHDPLTNTLNRRGLEHALEIIEKKGFLPEAILVIDLTNFKTINDHYGYEAGDQTLLSMTELLQSVIRKKDTLARIGGDEFVIVLGDENTDREIETNEGSRVVDRIDPSVKIDYARARIDHEIQDFLAKNTHLKSIGFDLAVGGVVWKPGDSYEAVSKRAEVDMKQAKAKQHAINGKHR